MADSTEFQIDPEAINRYVAGKIIESALGDSLKAAIQDQIKRISTAYDNPMKPVVASALSAAAREYLDEPEIKARLRSVVEEKLTEKVIDELIGQLSVSVRGY